VKRRLPLIPKLGPEPRDLWLTEDEEVSWKEWLANFKADAYPTLFEPYGLTLAEAMLLWSLNEVSAKLPKPNEGDQ